MATHYPLIVAQYQIKETWHWSIVVLRSRTVALVFELNGTPGNYVYQATPVVAFTNIGTLRGGVQVGTISAANLVWFENKLNEIPICDDDPSFDSQMWVVDALRIVTDAGLPSITINNERRIREELLLDFNRWDRGAPTIEQRLYP
jgi:hypothetical protein